ncbi:restriction endonuclease subunit S [Bacteroides cellulolyticus]|uniref:restriction endonuclease subunit S n=2 Tax=Bacteroides TaxID=816 RepID=UPI0012AB8E61|nr:restriction endonuclease subunit S [uncultured Bacteroides sp.]MCU6770293.1 restriction endonuclease subunit S [Bacteroides cellulolyticus]
MTMTNNKDKKVLNVPNLRFPEFTGEWKKERLDEIAELSKGIGISKEQLSSNGNPCILYGELYTKYKSEIISEVISKTNIEKNKLKHSKQNDVIIPCSGETAVDIAVARCVPFDNVLLGGDLNIIRLHKYDGAFMAYQLNSKRKIEIAKLAQGVSVVHLYGENLKSINTYNPSLQEQQKIVRLLSLLDERIATQNKIIEDLKKLKSAICEKLFSSPKDKQPQIRLYGFFGDWHFVRLSDICHRICRKNTGEQCKQVLTIAAQYGLVSQEEFFNKNVASENLSGYYLLQKGDFAYNKSYSGDYVWGTVKRLDNYEQGVLSPLYICFRPDPARVDSDFLIYYFESKKWHKTVANIAGEGARNHGLLNISVVDYFNTIHCIPSMDEQKQIAQIIGTLLSKIAREQRMLNCYAAQRQYLLRQMFI